MKSLSLRCLVFFNSSLGLTKWLIGKESACQCKICRRHGLDSWVGKVPWRRKWQSTPVFLPGKNPMDRGAWWATVHEVTKSQTRLSSTSSLYNLLFVAKLICWLPQPCLRAAVLSGLFEMKS